MIHRNIDENKDSIEIGTPSKGGAIKVYGDSKKPDEFMIRIDNMRIVVEHARMRLVDVPK